MKTDIFRNFIYVLVIATASLLTSFLFGNQGVESFYSLYITTGIIYTYNILRLLMYIFRSRRHIILKILTLPIVITSWLTIAGMILVPIVEPNINSAITTPDIQWWLVSIAVVALLYRMNIKKHLDLKDIFVGITSGIFSVVIMFIAFIGYFGIDSLFRTTLLILSVNLMYIANFIFNETYFVSEIHKTVDKRMGSTSNLSMYTLMFFVSLPYLIPFAIIFWLSTAK